LDTLSDYIAQTNFPWVFSNFKSKEEWKPIAEGVEYHIIEKYGLRVIDYYIL